MEARLWFVKRQNSRWTSPMGAALSRRSAPHEDNSVIRLLNSKEWQSLSGTRVEDIRRKLSMIEDAGFPPMKLLPASELERLGRIPRSDVAPTVDAREALSNNGVLIFVSHRWLSPEERKPDDGAETKALCLSRFARWYEARYKSRKVYFWLDFASVDQHAPSEGIRSLPLYVAACNDMVAYETEDYRTRAWCMVERLIAYKFSTAGIVPWVVLHDEARAFGQDEGKPVVASFEQTKSLLVDPSACSLTSEDDRDAVLQLKQCAMRAKAWTGGMPRPLTFGQTSISPNVLHFKPH